VVSLRAQMGTADRDYFRQEPPRRRVGALSAAPVTKRLLIANIAIFLVDMFIGYRMFQFGALTVQSAVHELRLWEFITFQFLHDPTGLMHILFNSIGLYFFGPFVERWWGNWQKFLIFYLLCGIAGGLGFVGVIELGIVNGDRLTPLVGASAGIYGLLIGTAVIAPDARVQLLFPPVNLAMRTFAIGLMAFAVVMIAFNWRNAGGEAGHLGGAVAGFLMMKFPWLLRRGKRSRKVDVIRPKAFRRRGESKLRPRSKWTGGDDDEVNRILDKVSRDGLGSLSEEERRKLQEEADR
jgi:membrane associated rhomboid family serine protease